MTTPLMYAVQAAALWSGLLILLMLVLSGVVVSGRRKHMVSFGDGGNADLMAASRAFGNCVEYATPGMAAMALLALVIGVIAAVKAVGLQVPLVVRLEGTNVEEGKQIIRDSGLNVIPADDLDDAAQKIVAAVKKA